MNIWRFKAYCFEQIADSSIVWLDSQPTDLFIMRPRKQSACSLETPGLNSGRGSVLKLWAFCGFSLTLWVAHENKRFIWCKPLQSTGLVWSLNITEFVLSFFFPWDLAGSYGIHFYSSSALEAWKNHEIQFWKPPFIEDLGGSTIAMFDYQGVYLYMYMYMSMYMNMYMYMYMYMYVYVYMYVYMYIYDYIYIYMISSPYCWNSPN